MHDAPGLPTVALVTDTDGRERGLRFSGASPLLARAIEELRKGPRSSPRLAREVLGVRGGPEALADTLVGELLADHEAVGRDEAGRWRLREASVAPDTRLRELDYVVVDVETTGASPSRGDRITEIAAVEVSGGEVVDEFSTLVNPGRPIPPWISRLTGITPEMVEDAPPFEEVADLIRERLEGRVFVAHNVPFDWRFVTHEMRRARSVLPEGPRLCTLRLARRALPGLRRKGLDGVSRYFDVEIEARHRAAGDALATASVLLRLLELSDRRGVSRWRQMEEWLSGAPAPAERDDRGGG